MFKVLEVIYYTLIQLAQVNLLNFLLIMGLVVYLLFQLFQFLLPIFKQGYQKFQQLLDPTLLQERLNKAKKVWKNRSLKRTVKYLQANFGKLIKGLFQKIVALVFLIASNLLFRLFYLLPIVKRDRKRFEKEMKPILYFRSYRSMILMGVGFSLLVLFLTNYGVTLLRAVLHHVYLMVTNKNFSIPFPAESLLLQNLLNIRVFVLAPIIAFPIFIFGEVFAWKSAWINFEQYRDYNGNEKGNDRFATAQEIHKQYKKVPNKQKTYPGNGGFPVLHETRNNLAGWTLRTQMIYQNRRFSKYLTNAEKVLGLLSIPSGDFYIEDDPTSALGIGMTRSGKGEGFIASSVDINSRASIPPSMVLGDPKLEHYTSSYKTMRKRSFDVEVLNFQDMAWSMGYNPLTLAVDAARKGYYEKAQTYVNSVAEMLFPKTKGSDKGNSEYFRKSSVSLFNALTMALMDRAHETIQNGETDSWDTITIPNVTKFLTELGSEEVFVNSQNEIVESPEQGEPVTKKSKITVYFDNLRMVNRKQFSKFRAMADNEFRASDFGGEETKGNVYSSMVTSLNLFLQDNVAKIASKNSIDLASVGFPRRLSIKFRSSSSDQLENAFTYQTAKISIISTKKWGVKTQEVVHVKDATATVDEQGYLNFVIEPKLPDQFKIIVDFNHQNNDNSWVLEQNFTLSAEKVYKKNGKVIQIDKYSKKKVLDYVSVTNIEKPDIALLELKDIEIIYSDNPKIIFLGTPPHRSEYSALVSMFLHQLFNANYELSLSNGGKCINRILHILDEFTNLPAIPTMDTKISIGLGQNILYYLWIQNLEQLEAVYGPETAQTIQDNCALYIYVKSKANTSERFSKELGNRTITVRSKSANIIDEANPNVSYRGEDQPLLSPTQLTRLQEGESVIIRYVKGRDNQGFKSTLYPIFNHDKTAFPYRYMFLQQEFDRSMKPADIPVDSPHRNLNLQDIAVDAETGLTNLIQWRHDLSSCLSGGEAKLATRYKKQPQQASQQIYTAEEDLYEALAEEVLSDDYEGLFADDVI